MAQWGYSNSGKLVGPARRAELFPAVNGNRQSPVDIVTKDVRVDASLGPLTIDYGSARCSDIFNDGHTFVVNFKSSGTNVRGGPLSHNYRLEQFHCHWGSKSGQGSEHTVDGKPYDAEVHSMHWNTDLFQTVEDAFVHDKGMAVLTSFVGWQGESRLNQHDRFRIEEGFDPSIVLPVGPARWAELFPAVNGNRQSPVDIVTKDIRVDASLGPLTIDYSSASLTEVDNNGHTWNVIAKSSGTNLSGGPLSHNYRLEQFHCHWGSKSGQGSEHTVDGKPYDAELHIIHWNTGLFQTIEDALVNDQGIAVLTTFVKVGKENPGWNKLVALVDKVKFKDDTFCIKESFDPSMLLPENKTDYWTYEGGLTTPPCYECARFIIYREPVELSAKQFESFRALLTYKQGEQPQSGYPAHHSDNGRPIMPLNGRIISASFHAK